ncbi:ribose-phosphate pyrophosphokinase [Candidatus Uhrbacteria bacterium]|nr:ribose-phosphate pyrophosphokinase [Candidatus Uhrbacteria bacterium]
MHAHDLNDIRLFALPSHPAWAKEAADLLGIPLSPVHVEQYPLGQFRIQLADNVREKRVCIIGSTDGDTNRTYAELEQMISAASRTGAASVDVVMPYYGYARSDKENHPRVPIIARIKADILQTVGATRITSLNIHNPAIQGFFSIPFARLDITPLMILALKQLYGAKGVFTFSSPDLKGGELATPFVKAFPGSHLVSIWKKREQSGETKIVDIIGEVNGPTVLVDDEIATGGSMASAGRALHKRGATHVDYVAAHGIFSGEAWKKLLATKPRYILVSDSVEFIRPKGGTGKTKVFVLPIAPMIAEAIRRNMFGGSMHELHDLAYWQQWFADHPECPIMRPL